VKTLWLWIVTVLAALLATTPTNRAFAGPAGKAVVPMTEADARRFFVCRTRVSFDSGHGTQVSYMRPDGAVFLWYPGNSIVLPGKWDITTRETTTEPPRKYTALCFQYGANTYNPVTKQAGGQWNCLPAGLFARLTVDSADGDVFGLARRNAVPFKLSRDKTTVSELKDKVRSGEAREQPPETARDPGCPAAAVDTRPKIPPQFPAESLNLASQ
jgi:hypothetical protein